ncbi:MAG TPA: signal peptidase II [Candidatus Binatia bacterium]|jgi:signal peptidase II|nr:signal peptidase II [Candidatus Binatia bacterium]
MSDSRLRQALLVALLVVALDQTTKAIVERSMTLYESIPILPGFSLTYVRNTGAAFGMLAGAPSSLRLPLFLLVTAVAVWALVSYLRATPAHRRMLVWALGGILGGAVGNFICRLRYGEVVDFFHLHWGPWSWPMFNVADSAITVGVAIVLVESIRGGTSGPATTER